MMVVFFVLFARVIDPPPPFRSRESVRCVSRAKKKARKTARFRASRNRGKETERLFREREGESAFAYLFRDDVCVLISDDDGFLVAMIFFSLFFFFRNFSLLLLPFFLRLFSKGQIVPTIIIIHRSRKKKRLATRRDEQKKRRRRRQDLNLRTRCVFDF